jgi:hypothetical protein
MEDNSRVIERVQEWGESPEGHYEIDWDAFLYFICDKNAKFLKIGISKDPAHRLKNHQTSNPRRLILLLQFYATQQIETKLHNYLKQYNLRGEWYPLSGDNGWKVQSILKELCLGYFCGMTFPVFDYVYGLK